MTERFFSSNKRAFYFVLEEAGLLTLWIAQLILLLGINISSNNILFFQRPITLSMVIWFFCNSLFLLVLYFGIALRDKKVMKIHKDFSKIIFGTAKQKVFGIDRETLSLLLFEFLFAIIIALSIAFYLDPELEFPGLSKVPFPLNLIMFLAFVIFGIYLFSKTKPFREMVYEPSLVSKKILPAERLFPTKRITNPLSGSVRVKPKEKFNKRERKKNIKKKK
jgi:hypothetical protein